MTSCRSPLPPLDAERQALVLKWQRYALQLAQRWCRMAHQVPHAEDVKVEALLGLVEGAHRWQPGRGSFASCAHYYVLNRLRKYEREGARRPPAALEDGEGRLHRASGVQPRRAAARPGRRARRHELLPAEPTPDRLEAEDAARLFAEFEDTLTQASGWPFFQAEEVE